MNRYIRNKEVPCSGSRRVSSGEAVVVKAALAEGAIKLGSHQMLQHGAGVIDARSCFSAAPPPALSEAEGSLTDLYRVS